MTKNDRRALSACREAIAELGHTEPARRADLQVLLARVLNGLTKREREVLVLVSAGRTNKQIAAEPFISESTAGVHVSNILGKLGVSTRTEAASVALNQGLVGA